MFSLDSPKVQIPDVLTPDFFIRKGSLTYVTETTFNRDSIRCFATGLLLGARNLRSAVFQGPDPYLSSPIEGVGFLKSDTQEEMLEQVHWAVKEKIDIIILDSVPNDPYRMASQSQMVNSLVRRVLKTRTSLVVLTPNRSKNWLWSASIGLEIRPGSSGIHNLKFLKHRVAMHRWGWYESEDGKEWYYPDPLNYL